MQPEIWPGLISPHKCGGRGPFGREAPCGCEPADSFMLMIVVVVVVGVVVVVECCLF